MLYDVENSIVRLCKIFERFLSPSPQKKNNLLRPEIAQKWIKLAANVKVYLLTTALCTPSPSKRLWFYGQHKDRKIPDLVRM